MSAPLQFPMKNFSYKFLLQTLFMIISCNASYAKELGEGENKRPRSHTFYEYGTDGDTTTCDSDSEYDDNATIEPSNKKVRSYESDFHFSSQSCTFSPVTSIGSHIPCISVDVFLKKCASILGIYHYGAEELILNYTQENIITVVLKEEGKQKCYRVFDPFHHLMNKQEFCPRNRPKEGTRVTGIYNIEEKPCLFFKQWPEAPEREKAVYNLYLKLFPEDEGNVPFPKSETILMNDQVFLISEWKEGKTLKEIFEVVKQNSKHGEDWSFDLARFQKLMIVCMLICPEDLRSENCLLREIAENSNDFEFIPVDNERSIPELEHIGCASIGTRTHCALLGFHELLTKNMVINFSINVDAVMRSWVIESWKESIYMGDLRGKFKRNNLQRSMLRIFHSLKCVKKISDKLVEINKKCLGQTTLADLIWHIDPCLAFTYQIPRLILPSQATSTDISVVENLDLMRVSHFPEVSTNILRNAYLRIQKIDSGREGSTTPPSANFPLSQYFYGDRYCSVAKLLDLEDGPKFLPGKFKRQSSL